MQGQGSDQNVETVKDTFGTDEKAIVSRWQEELRLTGKNDNTWLKRASRVVARYRDERISNEKSDKKYNVLWSNTETIKPALYFRTPKPMVDRRNKDREDSEANKIAREAASALERCLEYTLDEFDFDGLMTELVEDYQLPGRAVAKAVYNPVFKEERMAADPLGYNSVDPLLDEVSGDLIEQPDEPYYDKGVEHDDDGAYTMEDVVDWESAGAEYVYWKDYRQGKAKVWAAMPWVAFGVDMSRDDLHKRFDKSLGKEKVDKIPLNKIATEINREEVDDTTLELFKRARVWEIWDKDENKVCWICTDYKDSPLDSGPPPLKFKHFYPCNRPLTMVENNGEHEPIPEYVMYQDQAKELDLLTMRINLLFEAVKVAGVYDKSNTGVVNLLSKDNENKLIGVSNWAMFTEKGGVKGAISWLPIDMVVAVLETLYKSREAIKQDMYELTGIADIIRGASDARETAAAQQIKGKFASMRLQDKQKKVARAARDILRLIGEIISENFSKETIEVMSGMQLSDEAYELLQNDAMRRFTIGIETDSTIQPNEREEQDSRTKFIVATSRFIKEASQVSSAIPEFTSVMGQLLMFGMRSFRVGRDLEDEMETAIDGIKKRVKEQQSQQGQKPDPKMVEAQAKAKATTDEAAQKSQHSQVKHDSDMAVTAVKAKQDENKAAGEGKIIGLKLVSEARILKMREDKERLLLDHARCKVDAAKKHDELKAQNSDGVSDVHHGTVSSSSSGHSAPNIEVNLPEIKMPDITVNVDANGDKKIILTKDKKGNITGESKSG
jgi:hypothetical protein